MVVYHETTRVPVNNDPLADATVETKVVRYEPADGTSGCPTAFLIRTAVYVMESPSHIATAVETDVPMWQEDITLLSLAAAVRRAIKQHDETVSDVERVVQWAIEEHERKRLQRQKVVS